MRFLGYALCDAGDIEILDICRYSLFTGGNISVSRSRRASGTFTVARFGSSGWLNSSRFRPRSG